MMTYAVVGLGYVGLGLAVGLAKKFKVLGYDINENRIHDLKNHLDKHQLVESEYLQNSNLSFTHQLEDIKSANFYIISVSTPAYFYEIPNLDPLINATKQIASILKKGDIVVFESTVYPGTTSDICIPILEAVSALKNGHDFHVGYSPERINPGDSGHTLKTITKIVSAQSPHALEAIIKTYESICDHVYPVSNLETAEAVKILENTQRDVNIALMNEFTKIMHAMNLNTHEIIEGAKTKFGFVAYKPGFVGGHCISIDPHYLAFAAKRHGVHPELILAARQINDGMTQFVIQSMIKLFIKNQIQLKKINIGLFGVTYKENVVDTRNSLALKLLKELKEYGFNCVVHDPLEHIEFEGKKLELTPLTEMKKLTAAILVVGHDYYREKLKDILDKCEKPKILLDIPNFFVDDIKKYSDIIYWNL